LAWFLISMVTPGTPLISPLSSVAPASLRSAYGKPLALSQATTSRSAWLPLRLAALLRPVAYFCYCNI
jgi:hypothetical protein